MGGGLLLYFAPKRAKNVTRSFAPLPPPGLFWDFFADGLRWPQHGSKSPKPQTWFPHPSPYATPRHYCSRGAWQQNMNLLLGVGSFFGPPAKPSRRPIIFVPNPKGLLAAQKTQPKEKCDNVLAKVAKTNKLPICY